MRGAAPLSARLFALLLACSCPARAELTLGVPADEPAPTVAAVLAGLEPGGEAIRLVAYDDASRLSDDLRDGYLDLALLEAPGAPVPGISAVADLYPSVLHVMHRQDTAPTDLADVLDGAAVWAGLPGGPGWRLGNELAAERTLRKAPEWLADPWSRDPEVYFIFGGLLAPDARSRLPGFQLWSFDDPLRMGHGSVVEGIVLRHPQLRPFVLPAALYPELGVEPALTLAVSTLLVARDAIEESRIYALAAEVERAGPSIAAVYPMAGLTQAYGGDAAVQSLGLHAGAQRYRDRYLPTFLERYAEVLALLATLSVAAVSGVFALRSRRRQARKDRLDVYYSQILALRPPPDAPLEVRHEARSALYALQAEVFDLVVAERIEADSSLVAFLVLSNRVLQEVS